MDIDNELYTVSTALRGTTERYDAVSSSPTMMPKWRFFSFLFVLPKQPMVTGVDGELELQVETVSSRVSALSDKDTIGCPESQPC